MSEAKMAVETAMRNEIGTFLLIGLLILGLGVWFGYVMREWSWIPRKKQRQRFNDAPVPVDLGYDPNNPMNSGRGRETVEICGREWYLMK